MVSAQHDIQAKNNKIKIKVKYGGEEKAISALQKVIQTIFKTIKKNCKDKNVANCNQFSKSSTLPFFPFLVCQLFARKSWKWTFVRKRKT